MLYDIDIVPVDDCTTLLAVPPDIAEAMSAVVGNVLDVPQKYGCIPVIVYVDVSKLVPAA